MQAVAGTTYVPRQVGGETMVAAMLATILAGYDAPG
jgi:hypothetical protein